MSRRILIACEESQAVTKEFRKLGLEAFSCDLVDCSGGFPEWHLKTDVLELLKMPWDMILAFPPCTYLTVSGNRWFDVSKYGEEAVHRLELQKEAVKFFMAFIEAQSPRIAVENPIGRMSSFYRKPDQVIQPWQFGHGEKKATCLWLQGLPKLCPTKVVEGREERVFKLPPSEDRAKLRSKTFPGIARAMAEQWSYPLFFNE